MTRPGFEPGTPATNRLSYGAADLNVPKLMTCISLILWQKWGLRYAFYCTWFSEKVQRVILWQKNKLRMGQDTTIAI
jgi:hypothetical protein